MADRSGCLAVCRRRAGPARNDCSHARRICPTLASWIRPRDHGDRGDRVALRGRAGPGLATQWHWRQTSAAASPRLAEQSACVASECAKRGGVGGRRRRKRRGAGARCERLRVRREWQGGRQRSGRCRHAGDAWAARCAEAPATPEGSRHRTWYRQLGRMAGGRSQCGTRGRRRARAADLERGPRLQRRQPQRHGQFQGVDRHRRCAGSVADGAGQYDIIASEPSNPYRAGVASLFTQEFYHAASQRLSSDGVFAQWVQAYEIDARTLATIYATMHSVFAAVETWETQRGDFVLLGTNRERPYQYDTLVRRISEEPYRSAIYNAWRAVDIHGVLAHFVGDDALTRAVPAMARAVVNTDDRNIVEFGLARSVGRRITLAADVRALAHQSGSARPHIDGGEGIRWAAVDTAWVSYSTEQGGRADGPIGPSAEEQRRDALRRYFERNDATGAHLSWSAQTDGPRDLNELAMLADVEAASGNDAALPLIERLRTYQPGEAATLLASLRFRQSKLEEAADAMVEAFAHFRVSPWTATRYARRALEIARRAPFPPALTRLVFDALEQPFANLAVNEQRLTARVELALKLSQNDACLAALSAFGQRTAMDRAIPEIATRLLRNQPRSATRGCISRPHRIPAVRSAVHSTQCHEAVRYKMRALLQDAFIGTSTCR